MKKFTVYWKKASNVLKVFIIINLHNNWYLLQYNNLTIQQSVLKAMAFKLPNNIICLFFTKHLYLRKNYKE